MKTKYLLWYLFYAVYYSIFAFSNAEIGKTSYMFQLKTIFPTPSRVTTDNGIDNISDYIIAMIPLVTTLMAIGATVMIVLGGFHMVMGGASTDQTEKWKGILKDAVIGLLIGLLAYVIIMTLWNILGV
jgi:small-conductance mechanosensitive channel